MPEKATWAPTDLQRVGNFTEALQDFLQEWREEVPIKDAQVVLSEGDHTIPWGLVSVTSQRDLTVQFETGQYDIGNL